MGREGLPSRGGGAGPRTVVLTVPAAIRSIIRSYDQSRQDGSLGSAAFLVGVDFLAPRTGRALVHSSRGALTEPSISARGGRSVQAVRDVAATRWRASRCAQGCKWSGATISCAISCRRQMPARDVAGFGAEAPAGCGRVVWRWRSSSCPARSATYCIVAPAVAPALMSRCPAQHTRPPVGFAAGGGWLIGAAGRSRCRGGRGVRGRGTWRRSPRGTVARGSGCRSVGRASWSKPCRRTAVDAVCLAAGAAGSGLHALVSARRLRWASTRR